MKRFKKKSKQNYCASCCFGKQDYIYYACIYMESNDIFLIDYIELVDCFNKGIKCPWYKKR